ncbi:hypothetical protein ACWPKO_25505 (plasmid) [Coraliomargarita sp. W4R53]
MSTKCLRLPAAATAALLAASVFLVAPAAHAATFGASDEATLVQAITDANTTAGPDIITVTADINASPGIGISAGNTATIADVTLTARGTFCDAAVGGWNTNGINGCAAFTEIGSGEIVIVDATVNATAPYLSTAIGSGFGAVSGDVTILRSEVTTSGSNIGIGTPENFALGALSVTASTLTDVNVRNMLTSLEGANMFAGVTDFRSFATTNNGVVEVAGSLSGSAITNSGTIYPASKVLSTNVAGNAFVVSFDDNHVDAAPAVPVTVYAPTLADVDENVPTPSRAGFVIAGWNTSADASGTELTDETALSSVAAGGAVTAYAIWEEQVLLLNTSNTALTAGDNETFTVTANEPFGEIADLTSSSTFTSSNASDQVAGATVTFTEAGTRTITATHGTTVLTASVSARAAATSSIVATPSATSVDQGGSITLIVTGTDAYGNPSEVDPADVVVTSDVATDEIDGLKVTFPDASPHVLTVSVGDISTSTTIEVIAPVVPAPTPTVTPTPTVEPTPSTEATATPTAEAATTPTPAALPATGGALPALPLLAGVLLTLLGGAALALTAHRRKTHRI